MAKRLSWAVRLERAEKRGRFTELEVSYARDSWLSCAVGEKHHWSRTIYERTEAENDLGQWFGRAVAGQDIEEAKRIYQQIQELPA